jgi:hypothetical protein
MTRKKLSYLVVFFFLLCFVSCAEREKEKITETTPPPMSNIPFAVITMPAEGTEFDPEWVTQIPYGVSQTLTEAIPLTYFIDKSITDAVPTSSGHHETRMLFAYNQKATDGFSPRSRGVPDLTFDVFSGGYLLPNESFRSYFPDLDVNTYNTRNIREIELYRAITVVKINGDEVLFEISRLPTHNVPNRDGVIEPAIKLTDLITDFVTLTPERYEYEFLAVDGNPQIYEWSEMARGYFSISSDRTTFVNVPEQDMGNNRRFYRNVVKITLLEKS